MERFLVLEDGSYYQGEAIGSNHFRIGKMIFHTAMTGYQEIITDAANAGEIVVMTYPNIGAYGMNRDDSESLSPSLFGIVVKHLENEPSNFRYEETVEEYLKRTDIPGIQNVDTRAITKKIRGHGSMKATFCEKESEIASTIQSLQEYQLDKNLVESVSTKSIYTIPGGRKKVVLIDFGVKMSLIRKCANRGYDLLVVPYDVDAKTILEMHPDGVLLSNGPGDPRVLTKSIETIKELLPNTIVYGIGLGSEVLGLACGLTVEPLPFGHHGFNQAVVDKKNNQVKITAQNHNYCFKNLPENVIQTYQSLNDETCEGFLHQEYQCQGIEFDPMGEEFFLSFEEAMGQEG